ncbi:MAG TPA: hypothetical protein VHJ58_22620 [Vicinamibacterales bacterium]|nr:hypothetical protein [Vicinamibacterales bacterium]
MTRGAEGAQIGDVEGETLIAAVWLTMVDTGRDAHPVLLETTRAQRLSAEHSIAKAPSASPSLVGVDGGAEPMALLLIGSGMLRTATAADRGMRTSRRATGAGRSGGHLHHPDVADEREQLVAVRPDGPVIVGRDPGSWPHH